jgi:hypothetical protein
MQTVELNKKTVEGGKDSIGKNDLQNVKRILMDGEGNCG